MSLLDLKTVGKGGNMLSNRHRSMTRHKNGGSFRDMRASSLNRLVVPESMELEQGAEQQHTATMKNKININTGSRRSRNSVYQIDPSLLERPGRIREIHSMEEFQERLEQAKESLVCVTFSAKWCGPWRMIKPDVHRLSHIHGDVEFYEVDVDENEEIAEARRVACMPTFQFFKRGIMLDKFAEPNRIKLDETIRKLRKMEIRPEE